MPRVKATLTTGIPAYKIIFKDGFLDAIKNIKGWKNDAEMARHIGITRQYFSQLKNGKVQVTCLVISRLAVLLGNIDKGWWEPFVLVPYGYWDINHPNMNEEKNKGRVPYSKRSTAFIEQRKLKEYDTETQI